MSNKALKTDAGFAAIVFAYLKVFPASMLFASSNPRAA